MKNSNIWKHNFKILFIFIFSYSLFGCVGSNTTTNSNNSSNMTLGNDIVVEKTTTIPVLNGQVTVTGVYVRNNSQHQISGIKYSIKKGSGINDLQLLPTSDCTTIAANSSCFLGIQTPKLTVGQSGGSMLIANYNGFSTKQLVNYRYYDTADYTGITFSDSTVSLLGKNDYMTDYVFAGGGQPVSQVSFNLGSDSLLISNGLTDGMVDIPANKVVVLELKSANLVNTNLVTITPSAANSITNSIFKTHLASQQVLINPLQQANLVMDNVPILSNSGMPSATITLLNNGSNPASSVTLADQTNFDLSVNPVTCVSNGTLNPGASCTYRVSLNTLDLLGKYVNNGSDLITLSYNNGLTTTTITQTVYFYNNLMGPMVYIIPTATNIIQNTNTTQSVIFNVKNIGKVPLNSASFAVSKTLLYTTVTQNTSGCISTLTHGINANFSCQVFDSVIAGGTTESGMFFLNLTGSDTTGASYSFISFPVSLSVVAPVTITASFTWVGGTPTPNQTGIYGTKGIPSVNNIPGARSDGASWIDASNNLWLFGGKVYDPTLGGMYYIGDLWKYDPIANTWTWVTGGNYSYETGIYGTKGIPNPNNTPGARSNVVSWMDSSGKMWLFGGTGLGNSFLNGSLSDLWKYDPVSNMWTWISGPPSRNQIAVYGAKGVPDINNIPGARSSAVSWLDNSGNMWLFGGADSMGGTWNDLWKYDPVANAWTWVSGESTPDQFGVYGTKGVPSANNTPGARYGEVSWTDLSGNLWLFGGQGYSGNSFGILGDLWKYDPVSNTWTWVMGESSTAVVAVFGTQSVGLPGNTPGSRVSSIKWVDKSGIMWLFGGTGYGTGSRFNVGTMNDLWAYNPSTNIWTWVSGSTTPSAPAVYGSKGISGPNNTPGGTRLDIIGNAWVDQFGAMWLFGGWSYSTPSNAFNDLWKIQTASH